MQDWEKLGAGQVRNVMKTIGCVLLSFVALSSAGCRGPWSKDWKVADMFDVDMTPWSDDGPEEGTPVRLIGTWTDTVLYQGAKTPQRGFGGRLIFYGNDGNDPILVDGQLVVYAFDETNREPTDNKPTRRYVFPPDQVARHMSKSELGPSYSFWLPWDVVGGPQTEVSLIARFEPKDGAVVIGEQTRHLLPGALAAGANVAGNMPPKLPEGIPMRPAAPRLSSASAAIDTNNQVQLASYEAAAEPSQRRMTTTSISLPENFRIRGGSTTATAAATATATASVQPNRGASPTANSLPQPNAVPNFRSLARPVFPTPSAYSAFAPPPQSPMGNGFVAAPAGQPMPGQPAAVPPTIGMPAATVTYFPVAGSAPLGANPSSTATLQPSFGFQPPQPPAPAPPAFR